MLLFRPGLSLKKRGFNLNDNFTWLYEGNSNEMSEDVIASLDVKLGNNEPQEAYF